MTEPTRLPPTAAGGAPPPTPAMPAAAATAAPPAPAALPWGGPLWVSAFRPFYLLGAAFAPLVVAAGALAWAGWPVAPPGQAALWHGHEMLFGFALAIVVGTVLTALPSWAGTPELRGGMLMLLALLWLAGRVACAGASWWPPGAAVVVALADGALLPVLIVRLVPQLARVADRRYAVLLPVLAALALANLGFHRALAAGDAPGAAQALRAALWLLVLLFTLKGGVLTPVFTGNVLVERGRGTQARFLMPLELAAAAALLALAAADLAGASHPIVGALALAALVLHGVRVARWRGWRAADEPLVAALNVGFAWLLAALALKAAAELGAPLPERAWVHAFTLGALGSVMLGLMTRVALRHTGRPLVAPPSLRWLLALCSLAAALRVAAAVHGLGPAAVGLAGALWAGCFVAWLARHGATLWRPSLPR